MKWILDQEKLWIWLPLVFAGLLLAGLVLLLYLHPN